MIRALASLMASAIGSTRFGFLARKILKYLLILPGLFLRTRAKGIVILTYHRVLGLIPKEMDIRTEAFERQMAYLARKGRVVSLDDVGRCRRAEEMVGDGGQEVVAVTFDDGYEDFYTHAFPILLKYRIPATLYVATSFIDTGANFPFDESLSPALKARSKPLSWKQIREMVDSGLVSIGSHTHTHRYFHLLDRREADRELRESKERIEDNLGRPVEHFCYPKNIHTDENEPLVRRYYRTAVVGGRTRNTGAIDHFRLKRIPVQKSDNFFLFKANLKGYTCLGFLDFLSDRMKSSGTA